MQTANSQAQSIVALVYKNGVRVAAPENLNILFDLPASKSISLTILANGQESNIYNIQNPSDGDVGDISNVRITPQYSVNGSYSALLDIMVEYDTSTGEVING